MVAAAGAVAGILAAGAVAAPGAVAATPAPPATAGTVIAEDLAAPAVTDGKGVVAWMTRPGVIHVLDAASGTAVDHDVTSGCVTAPAQVTAVGGGQALFDCLRQFGTGTRAEPRLLDLSTGAVQDSAALDATLRDGDYYGGGVTSYVDVGAQGVEFHGEAYHVWFKAFVNWHTGAEIGDDDTTAVEIPDLDAASLQTRLCSPIQRKPYDFGATTFHDGPDWDPFQYEPPYAVQEGPRTSLTIQRCGSTRRTVLQPYRKGVPVARFAQLASGFVTWIVPAPGNEWTLVAYLPACGARMRWPVSALSRTGHVKDGIVVDEAFEGGGPWRVRRLTIAGACTRATARASLWLSAGRRSTTVSARSGTVADRPSGATVALAAPTKAIPRFAAGAGARVAVRIGARARVVRWQVGGGRWRRARGSGSQWSLRAPRVRGPQTLVLDVRYADGGGARFEVRLARNGG